MKRLKAEDIIDLEIFIQNDQRNSEEYKRNRDFKIFSKIDDSKKQSEITLLKSWIEGMRVLFPKHSAGFVASIVFKLFSLVLFLIGALLIGLPLANAFFVRSADGSSINVSFFFITCVLIPLVLLFSAVFFAKFFGEIIDLAISAILNKIFKNSGGLRAIYATNKKWILLKGAICAQYFGLGIAVGIFATQFFRPTFNEYKYGWQTTLPQYVSSERMYSFVKTVALPWRIFAGEGVGYPSFEQIAASKIISDSAPVVQGESAPRYETWSVFFIFASLFYGVILRLIILAFYNFKLSRFFGIHRIRNDRKISEILRRMNYASSDSSLNLSPASMEDETDAVALIREDLQPWEGPVFESIKTSIGATNADLLHYNFASEILNETLLPAKHKYKYIALAYLSDDYNEEIFEIIEALVAKFPEAFISVHLLGRLSKPEGVFHAPPPVEKSWWERKINSVSTRNLKLF